jgi:hypothetical protein
MKKNKHPFVTNVFTGPYVKNPLVKQINRNFYTNLRKLGRSYDDIINMIQPERRDQFTIDTLPLLLKEHTKPSLYERIKSYFKTKLS